MVKTRHIDREKLEEAIQKSGYRPGYIIEQLGISKQGFHNKKIGKTAFRQSEVYVLCSLLGLSDQDKIDIFFPEEVSVKDN